MADRSQSELFGVESLGDYLSLVQSAVDEFYSHPSDTLKCYASMLLINHVSDWGLHKLTDNEKKALGLPTSKCENTWKNAFAKKVSGWNLCREVSNGLKHLNVKQKTEKVSDYGKGAYGVGPYGKPYLAINTGSQWQSASSLARETFANCKTLFSQVL